MIEYIIKKINMFFEGNKYDVDALSNHKKMKELRTKLETKIIAGKTLTLEEVVDVYQREYYDSKVDSMYSLDSSENWVKEKYIFYQNVEEYTKQELKEYGKDTNLLFMLLLISSIISFLAGSYDLNAINFIFNMISLIFAGMSLNNSLAYLTNIDKTLTYQEIKEFYNLCLEGIKNTRELELSASNIKEEEQEMKKTKEHINASERIQEVATYEQIADIIDKRKRSLGRKKVK